MREIAGPIGFHLLDWETRNLAARAGRLWAGLRGDVDERAGDRAAIQRYFAAQGAEREMARPAAEAALERAVARAYREIGPPAAIPALSVRPFPPVLAALTAPPNVLVISPRTELRVTGSVLLQAGLDIPAQEALERSVDSTGVSSLVLPIGGIATYPAMVLEADQPVQVLSSLAHEWVHHYLIFFPLGRAYFGSAEARTINETVADIAGEEVGRAVAQDLGLPGLTPDSPPVTPPSTRPPSFDFRTFMRATRLRVEALLSAGAVDEAERYMRDQRDELQRNGYAIRKLNQAYFAFYGSYAGGFAGSPSSPVPPLLQTIRARTTTVGDLLARVRDVAGIDELRQVAGGLPTR